MAFRRRRKFGNPDASQEDIVAHGRKIGATIDITTGVGGGFPDVLIGFQGRDYKAEIKTKTATGKRKTLKPEQQTWANRWSGSPTYRLDCPDDMTRLLLGTDADRELLRIPHVQPNIRKGKRI